MNWIAYSFIVFVMTSFFIELILRLRNKKHIKERIHSVPNEFAEIVSSEDHKKAGLYTFAKTNLAMLILVLDAAILLFLTVGGGANTLYQLPLFANFESVFFRDVIFVLVVCIALSLIHLPLSIYSTFSIEARFEFNRISVGTFCLDIIKQTILAILLGGLLLVAVLYLMDRFIESFWWLWAWALWCVFSLSMLFIFPTLIAPLFNKFKPLEDLNLKTKIEQLLKKTGLTFSGIFVMDGSKRSSHGNAYFTGFGKNKRIVFFDTLLEKLTDEEIIAVLAHELGHYAKGHIKKRIIENFVFSLIGFAIIGYILTWNDYFNAFQITQPTNGLILFIALQTLPAFFFFISPLDAMRSRKHEFEADAFAVKNSSAEALKSALVKLHRDNAASLTPDPVFSAYFYSHPPASIRLANIDKSSTS